MFKRSLWIVLTTLLITPAAAFAQTECGEFTNSNRSYQFGDYAWLEYIVATRRQVNFLCLQWYLGVEAHVVGVNGSGASGSDLFTAEVRRQVPVPNYGKWQTNGQHWRYLIGIPYSNGTSSSQAWVVQKLAGDCSSYNGGGDYYVWDGNGCVATTSSPIIIDVARDGYHLTSARDGVLFDLDADGIPERLAWTRADADDAFLAMDRNGNGRIDDGSELFGNHTPAHRDPTGVTTINGFEALRFLQAGSYGRSTLDRQIDGGDAPFSRLLLWRDANHNGLSEPEELTPAQNMVAAISTEYKEKKRVDPFGNQFRQQGRLTWTTGDEGIVYDVWLQQQK